MHAASFAYQCLQADAREHPCHPLIGPLGIFPRLVRRDNKLCFNSQTAQQAKDRGLVDEVMFEEPEELPMTAADGSFKLPTQDQMDKVRAMMEKSRRNSEHRETEQPETPRYEDAVRRNKEINQLRMSVGRNLM